MSPDRALELFVGLLQATMWVVGPVLGAALVAGVLVGIVQAATQINEASIAYVVKAGAVVVVLVTLGPTMADRAVRYTRQSFEGISKVVH